MFTEKNFKNALEVMNFEKISDDFYQNNFAMAVDFKQKKLFYPKNLKVYRDGLKNFSQNENFVVFECVNRLLQKGYQPQDIEVEKNFKLGHSQKSGRADICISKNEKIFVIIECKTFGAEFNRELENLISDGGQLFSYRQQEISCEWLILYASDFKENKIIFNSKSVSCHEEIYQSAKNVQDFFKIWSEKFNKNLADDVIFHNETVAYQIGVKPFRKKNLVEFDDTKIINTYEEILRHNSVTNKQNAFDALLELFICKLADESHKNFDDEVEFQFKIGADTFEIFIDRLQKLYHQGMEEFMQIPTTYTPLSVVENLLKQNHGESRKVLENLLKNEINKLKFYTPNIFNFVKVLNPEIFYMNTKIVVEVVEKFKYFKIIGAKNLQTLGDLFEQLLDKGFKQDEGQFFTPLPITKFIWKSLPLEKICEKNLPKIIDYACGAGHFLTQGFEEIKKIAENLPDGWEDEKIFGIEKNDRLSLVSKISFFMHGADKGKIKFGDGLENYPAEGISAESFDILVSNPPYSVKNFKKFLRIENKFKTLEKISENGNEIETLFVERISQLLKAGGIAAVILPSSILNKDGGSFICAREEILKNFYIRAIAEFGSKTFSATGTKTNILFLEKIFDPPQKFELYGDTIFEIFSENFNEEWDGEDIFDAWLKKIKIDKKIYLKFIRRETAFFDWKNDAYFGEYFQKFVDVTRSARDFLEKYGERLFVQKKIKKNNYCTEKIPELENLNRKFYEFAHEIEREKIQYFAQTFKQTTLIISAPDDNSEQEKFLGYKWSNRKGDEGIKITGEGLLKKLAEAVKKSFCGEKIQIPDAEKYFYYLNLADMIDFSGTNFTKTIKTVPQKNFEVKEGFKIFKLSSADFEIKIGDRVLSSEIISDGKIPVYSANVFEEFGRINKQNLQDFSLPSIIWGIDGDWMVNLIPAEKIFYPTDHCGVLRIKTSEIIPEYFKFVLQIAGDHEKFSRTNRASITRIKNLVVQIPTLEEQKKIVGEFKNLDEKIILQEKIISDGDLKIKNKFSEMFLQKDFPREKFEKVLEIRTGKDYKSVKNSEGKFPVYGSGGIIDRADDFICPENSVVIGRKGTINNPIFVREKFWNIDTAFGIIADKKFILPEYLFYFCLQFNFESLNQQLTLPSLARKDLYKILIPVPPKELQEKFAEFVKEVEVEKNSAIEEKKILTAEREALVEKYFR